MSQPLQRSRPEDAARYGLAWAEHPADLTSPVRLFLALRSAGREVCLLESAEGPLRLARWSFVGVDPTARFRGRRDASVLSGPGGNETFPGNPWDALRRVTREATPTRPAPRLPAGLPPFCGGWIGWLSYESATLLEPSVERARRDPWDVPDLVLDRYDTVVALDHAAQRLVVVRDCPSPEAFGSAQEAIEHVVADLECGAPHAGGLRLLDSEPTDCTGAGRFEEGVRRLRRAIAEGEVFQAVPSRRFERRFEGDAFTLYRALRLANPAPHMFFFEADGLVLAGSSPERLVSVRDGRAQLVPIAGTRPRDDDPLRDERLAAELLRDPKERAEHDMLVDLARNDLGRVARIGSVAVKEHAVLQRFARVQHLTSRVEADLATGFDAVDALAAAFPAGTVSGAPKIRAMQLLAEIEEDTRGPYAGAFGYLDARGNLDVCIAIRTLVARAGRVAAQAGAGVVMDSDPAREERETRDKLAALLESLELAAGPSLSPSAAAAEVRP